MSAEDGGKPEEVRKGPDEDLKYVLGSSRRVALSAVESSLADLWRLTGEEALARGRPGVVRVRELNLIIVATSQSIAGRVSAVVANLAQHHPGRVIVLLDEPQRAPEETTEAWVSAACYLNREGGRNVCWEQVTIPGLGQAAEHVVTMAIPYLVPDISVAAWWPGDPDVSGRVFEDLAEVSDKIILDAAGFADAASGLAALASVAPDPRFILADVTWNRLTPWREMVAAFFDDPARRALLPMLDRVELVYGEEDAYLEQDDAPHRPAVARALLLVGWLATRLGWQADEGGWEAGGEGVRLALRRADGQLLEVLLVNREYSRCGFGGLHQVSLELKPGQADGVRLSVQRAEDTCICAATVRDGSVDTLSRTMELRPEEDDDLLCQEIDYVGSDEVYQEALRFAASLAALPGVELLEVPRADGAAPSGG